MEDFNFHQYHLSLTQGSRINEIGGKHDDLRTFARTFSNIDFFLKILPLKDDDLVMSEM